MHSDDPMLRVPLVAFNPPIEVSSPNRIPARVKLFPMLLATLVRDLNLMALAIPQYAELPAERVGRAHHVAESIVGEAPAGAVQMRAADDISGGVELVVDSAVVGHSLGRNSVDDIGFEDPQNSLPIGSQDRESLG